MEDERLGLHPLELVVRRVDEERLREERMPGALGKHANRDSVGGIRSRKGVDDVDVALAQTSGDLLAEMLEALLGDLGIDVSPPDSRLGARLADDELVLGRAARVLPGVDDERTALGEARVAARQRMLVELRCRRMPEDVPAHRHPVLCELVPIGNDRDHEASCYADARFRGRFQRRASASRRRMRRMRNIGRKLLVAAIALAALVAAPTAAADYADEQALAERHAPVVRVVEQTEECGHGEPFIPTDINLILDEPTVALRGPWNRTDLVKIAPSAKDLVDRFEYHLDFPGDPLDPGCDYAHWAKRLTAGSKPVVYAHVVTEPERPGKVSLQYWFFYPFNDFNNTHEGDWEMIQLVFDANDAAEALGRDPVEVGYSAHEGATRSEWQDDQLEVVDGTRPVVYPAAGSHANKYSAALWLGSSAEAGVGCDDTQGPHRELSPKVETIPSDRAAAEAAYPWIAFEGRWGELQKAFFNGPTGPNLKTQWTQPITWSDGWSDRSYAIPAGGAFGTNTTDFFCAAVERGSRALVHLLRNPGPTLLVIAAILALAIFAAVRATWTPVAPTRIARRRAWGQIISASARMYVKRPGLFLGLGVLLIPIAVAITFTQWLLLQLVDLIGTVTGEAAGGWAFLAAVIGATFALLGLGLVQAATACALIEIDAGRPIDALTAYRLALRRLRPLLGAIAIFVAVWIVLTATVFLIPIAIWLAIRWSLVAPVVELEDRRPFRSLRRSADLVRSRWIRVGSLVGVSAAIALLMGPLLGAILIVLTDTPLAFLNIIAGIVYAVALPFVGLVTAYVYFDSRARMELEHVERPSELPAEIQLDVP